MLKVQQIAVIQLQNLVFGFMHRLPLKWNRGYSELVTIKSSYRQLPWTLSLVWTIPFGIASFYSSILSAFYPQPGRLQRVDTPFHFAVGILGLIPIAMTLQWFKEPSCIIGFNNLNKMAWKLSKEYKFSNQPDSILMTTSMLSIIGLLFISFIFVFGTVATELDAFFFIIEPLFPVPMVRNLATILSSTILRLVLIVPPTFEFCRYLAFLVTCIVIFYDSLIDITTPLLRFEKRIKQQHDIYVRLILIRKQFQESLHNLLWTVLSLVFWGVVLLAWLVIKGNKVLPKSLKLLFRTDLLVVLVSLVTFLPKFTKLVTAISNVGITHRQRAKMEYGISRSVPAKIAMLRANAVRPIEFWYGSFWVIGQDFFIMYLYLMTLRVFDALIILDFQK
ncbi:unnamed protein product [Orchesella dallaii]|uniref:Gustatory receptor n=1 Tax=Orchesella dallaii TaxID=48710 RepID=A0ABP1S443_9HEXA